MVPRVRSIDNAQVVVLCYHRLEGKAGGMHSIEPALFEKHMPRSRIRACRHLHAGLSRLAAGGEKYPAESVLITLDDGYVSGVDVGVPILKKHGFPATFFVYLEYINKGGKSVTWAQLASCATRASRSAAIPFRTRT